MAKSTRPETRTVESPDRSAAAANLAAQIGEIAHSAAISRAKKEKRISTAVRVAVVAATAYKKGSEEILGIALEMTRAAAGAAPQYAEVISNAVAFAPSLGRIDSASSQVRTAAFAAARSPRTQRKATIAATRPKPAARLQESDPEPMIVQRSTRRTPPAELESENEITENAPAAEMVEAEPGLMGPKIALGHNTSVSLTADLSVRRDDNVYLSNANKVADTILAASPGVEFRFGQNSLAHGSVSYKNAFTRYLDHTSPNVSLGNGLADFGYDNGSLNLSANAFFQQLNQNNSDVATLGQKAIYRRDVSGVNVSAESHLTAKTSVKSGVNYNKSEYKVAGLTGSQETAVPLRVYYEVTPKVSVSTGGSYRRVTPQNDGPKAKDWSYDVGARGNFTARLNGEFSVNYRTRQVESNPTVTSNPKEKLWGFNGGLNYEITPKTTSSLVFSRDFSTGALGESLKNSNYTFRVATELTPQWQISASAGFRRIEYGPAVFRLSNLPPALIDRNDSFWEGSFQATYFYRSWLTASADYTLRNSQSTLPGAEFSNSILSLVLGWRY